MAFKVDHLGDYATLFPRDYVFKAAQGPHAVQVTGILTVQVVLGQV